MSVELVDDYGPDLVLPRWCFIPAHIDSPGGAAVADLCADADYPPDAQQRLILDAIFARQRFTREEVLATFEDNVPDKRLLARIVPDDGSWPRTLSAAYETGIIAGRQNLKSGVCKQAAVGWLYIYDEPMIAYSAHVFGTAMSMFRDVVQMIESFDFLRKRLKRVIRNHGEESIELFSPETIITSSGSRPPRASAYYPMLRFMTRTKGGARGLSGSKTILDEAYALEDVHMGAILPIISAQPDPQILFGSAAGMADSDVLRDLRDRGREGAGRTAYFEWAAPAPAEACDKGNVCTHAKDERGCGCDKPQYWLEANPAIGLRMSIMSITGERRTMPVGEFTRERMGWWDEPAGAEMRIGEAVWGDAGDKASQIAIASRVTVGLDVQPEGQCASLCVAGWRPDGKAHVELVEHELGMAWVVDRLVDLCDAARPAVLMLDPAGPAGAFEKELRLKGFQVFSADKETPPLAEGHHRMHLMSARETAQACGEFSKAVHTGALRHPVQGVDGQPSPLDIAVKVARTRNVSQAWAWAPDPRDPAPITPLVAATNAYMGLLMFGARPVLKPFFLGSGDDDDDE